MNRCVGCGIVLVLACAPVARASVAYGINSSGGVLRFDTASTAAGTVVISGGYSSNASGITIDARGVGWSIDWSGRLFRLDLNAGTAVAAGILQPNIGSFYKDLAYDAANDRVLALHTSGTVHRIFAVNTANATYTDLGSISGVGTGGHVTGLAFGPGGEIAIADSSNSQVFNVAPAVGGGFIATARTPRNITPLMEALEFDPLSGDLLGGSPLSRFAPDGSYQVVRTSSFLTDLAFIPGIPTPGAGMLLGLAFAHTAVSARRRR